MAATSAARAKQPKTASQREKKGAQTATKPAARPAKRSTAKGATRKSASAGPAGRKAAPSGAKAKKGGKKVAATGSTPPKPAPKADPLPATPVGEKAKHDHQDPRLAGQDKTGPGLQGHKDPSKENYGVLKQRGVPRFDAVKNWFRRGRGR